FDQFKGFRQQPALGADDADRDRLPQSQGAADGQGPIANLDVFVAVGEDGRLLQVFLEFGGDVFGKLDNSKIGQGIGSDGGRVGADDAPAGEGYAQPVCAFNDVMVREYIAGFDKQPRALAMIRVLAVFIVFEG